MDCEMHEIEPRVLTEYGLNTFSRKEMAPVLRSPGIHGENILRNIYYYHIRVRENAHLINWRFVRGNPERNHFGSTRFATKEDAKEFLVETLAWPIDDDNEDGPKCPVIFLGHSVKNDLQMLQQDLGIDPKFDSNVVAIIDTQKIANEQGIRGKGQQIGLPILIQHFGVEFRDGHTASNDAAYTIISAVQMVLKNSLPTDPTRSLQDVVNGVAEDSKGTVVTFGPAARHADEDEEEKRNCGCEADHDGFAVNAEVDILVGVGGSGAFCWCSGGCDNRGSERCSCHGGFCLG
ncbi:hypothetical protein J4E86_000315 [Alternaria arbusti]|uniref:uncharacterized protein n=1 Tax=Alternaria arbusti TaxID=232088 RepID=UPI00221EE56C|nr:uncharacterized protein J4E86_000315 [Alternaria arbusti]KAI4961288.1 hypothetical protein J4E86_000315 [Alternaria arbusti]